MADIGTGASVTFGTSGFSASIESINHNDISREAVNSSHLGTTNYHTFIPTDLTDPGEMELEIQHDPDEQLPINGAAETITITYPVPSGLTNGATHQFSGFLTNYSISTPLEDKMMATITVKASGTITFTDAS